MGAEHLVQLVADHRPLGRDDQPGVPQLVHSDLVIPGQRVLPVDDETVLHPEQGMDLKLTAPVRFIADGEVAAVLLQIPGAFVGIALADGDVHIAVRSQQELLEGRGTFGNDVVHAQDEQVALGLVADGAVMVLQGIEIVHDVPGMVEEILAVVGQHQRVALAVKKVAAQLLLQPPDGAAETLLGNKHAVGGLRNAAEFTDL